MLGHMAGSSGITDPVASAMTWLRPDGQIWAVNGGLDM